MYLLTNPLFFWYVAYGTYLIETNQVTFLHTLELPCPDLRGVR